MQRIARPLLVAFFPASIVWSSAGGTAFYLLAILGIVLLARPGGSVLRPWHSMPELVLGCVILVALDLGSVLVFGLPAREFSWLALLAAPLIAVAAAQGGVRMRHLYASAALAGIVALGVALADWAMHGAVRPTGSLNAIVFGQLAIVCALYALAGALHDGKGWNGALYLVGMAAALGAAAASGSRGVLLALPVLLALAWRGYRRARRAPRPERPPAPRARRALIVGIALFAIATAAIGPQLPIWERFGELDDEYQAFQEGRVGVKSFAQRLAMWRASITLAAERPWFGHGARQFGPALKRLQARGDYPVDSIVYSHPHNLLLSILVAYGIAGILAFGLAGWLLWRAMGRAPEDQAFVGRLTIVAWMLLGLTNDVFAHQNTLRFIAIALAVCAAARAVPRDELAGTRAAAIPGG